MVSTIANKLRTITNKVLKLDKEVRAHTETLTEIPDKYVPKTKDIITLDFGYEVFNGVVIGGTTYNNVELPYIKVYRNTRYFLIGAVISGNNLVGKTLVYNSHKNTWTSL